MDVLIALLVALIVLALPFIVPIVAWMSVRRVRSRVGDLEATVNAQQHELKRLIEEVRSLRRATPSSPGAEVRVPASQPAGPATPPALPMDAVERARPLAERPQPPVEQVLPAEPQPPTRVERPVAPMTPAPQPASPVSSDREPSKPEGPAKQPETRPTRPAPPRPPFDWESLIGVKLFSAIAGIALVIAAVFFLRYSIESGWLQPPVRVAIGVIVAVALLVTCELKAARRYRVTANALDAAAISILFSTFFAAHALWDLIPAPVTFGLLILVTALAVMLSIRRESLFIAVLGLLGGFATPALLSTGENRPIPLFGYLLLLNVGLAWVAYQKRWPVLAWLTLIFTTLYEWGWVITYLDASSLPLAMGVFILFPVVSVAALLLNRTPGFRAEVSGPRSDRDFNRSALSSSVLPLLFGVYLAAVPEYGARPALLFGFVLLIDAGLLAIALVRREELLHATGALATILTLAIWLATSYSPEFSRLALGFAAAFALFFAFAPALANRFGRPFERAAAGSAVAGSFVLFVFPVIAGSGDAFTRPGELFFVLLVLLAALAARAIASRQGSVYFVAAFFAVATQAVWSAAHLTRERLGTAVAIYAIFGLVALGVPLIARRVRRPLEPAWGGGAVLLGSLLLLLFISTGAIAPEALWALALLLAILNAALFVETAGASLPKLSQAGSIISWIVLAMWWSRAAGSVGVVPALTVLTGLTLITLAGHAWSVLNARRAGVDVRVNFSTGLYLALVGHFFLAFLATNPEWALPPWPLFGSLAVMTLAMSAAGLATRTSALHTAGVIASAIVIAIWSEVPDSPPYGSIAIAASVLISAYAIGWTRLVTPESQAVAGVAAVGSILAGAGTALAAGAGGAAPPFTVLLAVHAATVAALLWLSARFTWRWLPIVATFPAWLAIVQAEVGIGTTTTWSQLLILSSVLYAVFAAFPFVLGRRAGAWRQPYIAALIASVLFFLGGKAAFDAGGLEWMVGTVPVSAGAVLALLLRQLLSIQPSGERDLGRLALMAGGALAFVTVAIPLQLEHQWITIGWALEGVALAWLYGRIPHRGLLYATGGLLAVVFVRLALNPEILLYEPRGSMRILNWYLYTYLISAAAMFVAAWWLSKTGDRIAAFMPRLSAMLPAAGVILLFLLLNIEIADFYATGPTITFRFGATVSQDLTYTIGWLAFGMLLLAVGIYLSARPARVAAVSLIAVTTFKCFLYDLGSLEGLYRVASFVGLAMSLALVAIALQRFVLSKPRETA